jgi:hypothetical protein
MGSWLIGMGQKTASNRAICRKIAWIATREWSAPKSEITMQGRATTKETDKL